MALLNLTIDAKFVFDPRGRLHVRVLDPKAQGLRVLNLLPSLIGYRIRHAEKVFHRLAADHRDVHYFRRVADAFRLTVHFEARQLEPLRQAGPAIVVANHPLNGIDGIAIAAAVSQVRADVKAMLTSTFDGIPGISPHGIFVNASNGPSAPGRSAPVRQAIDWLRGGHVVVLFPAGQGSYLLTDQHKNPVDDSWNPGVAVFLKGTEASVLPIFVEGRPSRVFLKTRKFYRPLSTLFLLREILIQEGATVRLRIGKLVPGQTIQQCGDRRAQVEYLRSRTYQLDD